MTTLVTPIGERLRELAQALADAIMSEDGQLDVHPHPVLPVSVELPTITVTEAAEQLGLSRRQTTRLAPRLGGRRVAGRWLLDATAVREHLEGRAQWTG